MFFLLTTSCGLKNFQAVLVSITFLTTSCPATCERVIQNSAMGPNVGWQSRRCGFCIKDKTGFLRNYKDLAYFLSRPFLSSPGPLYQNEVKSSAFDMKMIFHSHANKTCFHKKGCALGLILKVRVFGTRKSPVRILRPWDLSLNRWLISFTFN